MDVCNKLSALFVISAFVETSLGVDTKTIFVQRNNSKETGVFYRSWWSTVFPKEES